MSLREFEAAPMSASSGHLTELWLEDPDCPDDFVNILYLQGIVRRTKKELEKAIDDAIANIVQQAETKLNCSKYKCDDDDKCEFDYMADIDPPKKIYKATKKHGKKRRWVGGATIFVGCFCPGSDDDPEEDPKDDPKKGQKFI